MGIPRCNQFPKTSQTDINNGKLPASSIWLEPNLSMKSRRYYRTTRRHPAPRGSGGFSLPSNFLIWMRSHHLLARKVFISLWQRSNDHILHQSHSETYQEDFLTVAISRSCPDTKAPQVSFRLKSKSSLTATFHGAIKALLPKLLLQVYFFHFIIL